MRQTMSRWSMFGVCVLLIALAGCGKTLTTSGAGVTNGGAAPTATPSGSSVKPIPTSAPLPTGTVQAIGCPLPVHDVTWPPPAPQRLSPEQGRSATLGVGQTLEVVVPYTAQWRLTQDPPSNILSLDSPAGYGDQSLHSCVWHFTAKAAGQVTLTYSLSPLCVKGQRCSGTVTLVDFTVSVQ